MITDVVEFLPDIQSINPTEITGFVLFCNTDKNARSIQHQLLHDFNIPSILDVDNYGAYYAVPLENLDDKTISKFIHRGWDWDRDQKFVQHLITLYNEDAANNIYNILIAHGYNVILNPNNLQLVVKCIADSERNTAIAELKNKLETFEKTSPKSIDDYFNKILFNGIIENPEYRKVREQEFSPETIEQAKDLIIREILYRYFNTVICAHLTCPKFDANKLDTRTIQNINLIRDFLYSVASQYIDTQVKNSAETKHNPRIRFNYLNTCSEYDDVNNVLKLAIKWSCSNAINNRIEQHTRRISERGAYKLMDLNNGYYVVRLGDQDALDYENRMLKHQATIYYNDDIYKGFSSYSIRKGNTPILTLEVHNNELVQCYGYKDSIPCDNDLRLAVRTFMHARDVHKQDLTIPGSSWNKLIAYIKQNGVLYDVFDLPKNFVLNGALDLENMGLDKLPNMSTTIIKGNLLCVKNKLSNLVGAPYMVLGNCDFSQNPLESLVGMPRYIGGLIYLHSDKLTAESFVPIYLENKLDDILGVDKAIINAWRTQIAIRKKGLQNIMLSLRENNK